MIAGHGIFGKENLAVYLKLNMDCLFSHETTVCCLVLFEKGTRINANPSRKNEKPSHYNEVLSRINEKPFLKTRKASRNNEIRSRIN